MTYGEGTSMVSVLEDLAIPARRAILASLLDGPKNVTELVRATGLKQPNVSNHLAKMRGSRTVKASRIGREIFYTFGSPDTEASVRSAVWTPPPLEGSLDLPSLASRYAEQGITGDEGACTHIVDAVLKAGVPPLQIYEDLLAVAMALIGSWYQKGQIDEGQEHAASAITERLLARIAATQVPRQPNGLTVVIGCAANNWHTIGVRMLADYLKSEGFRVIYLGPNVPEAAFVNAVNVHDPDVVLVSTSAESVAEARSLVLALRASKPDVPLAVGGSGITSHRRRFEDLPIETPGPGLKHVADWIYAHALPTNVVPAK